MLSSTNIAGTTAESELRQELAAVVQELRAAREGLFPPFSQLVQLPQKDLAPLTRAAVVLTAGVGAPDDAGLREQRIYLAAALEMLHLALNVHTTLLGMSAPTNDPSRSLLGSTILAGDFCFSRSAGLAVRTGNAAVVAIFADALKRVSEGHLRHLFEAESPAFDETRELIRAGIVAAATLTGADMAWQAAATRFGDTLATALATGALGDLALDHELLALLQPEQHRRWDALLTWFRASHSPPQ